MGRIGYLAPARVGRVHAAGMVAEALDCVEGDSAVGNLRWLMAGKSPDCCRALLISTHLYTINLDYSELLLPLQTSSPAAGGGMPTAGPSGNHSDPPHFMSPSYSLV